MILHKNLILKLDQVLNLPEKMLAEEINEQCQKAPGYRILGGGCMGNSVLLSLSSDEPNTAFTYAVSLRAHNDIEELVADINTRYSSGFRFVFCFEAQGMTFALYELSTKSEG